MTATKKLTARLILGFALCALPPVAGFAQTYKRIAPEDFFLDRKTMIGQRVEVVGQFQAAGDVVFIVLDGGRNATFVSMDRVPREHRKAVSRQCMSVCGGTAMGRVAVIAGLLGSDVGIVADDLVLK